MPVLTVEINYVFVVILEILKILPATCNKDYGLEVPSPNYPLEVNIIV